MQYIITRYYGPGNRLGSRIKAKASGGLYVWHNYDDALNAEENHRAALVKLCNVLDWHEEFVAATNKDGSQIWVMTKGDKFTVK